ncbi:L-type lectin-domain containing receptor kinase IV.1-like [Humulus lupulus]|uniref:L-type lectin-domain containing receptor kinase IV.1-like n=1 Tax=Humulus lupulus TaxID=3486 RepID=UPI002B410EF2|nr:L-type lectin-domain containing receptor kinase IV.1-like [Humulus lupulus]
MFRKLVMNILLVITQVLADDEDLSGFTFTGFKSNSNENISLSGEAAISDIGLLRLTNTSSKSQKGSAFYSKPLTFKYFPNTTSTTSTTCFSFSTTFVFAIKPGQSSTMNGHGMALAIAPTLSLPGASPNRFLGLFNESNNGNATNHVVAVELDTNRSKSFQDIDDNHVGIDINGLESVISAPAAYFVGDNGEFKNLSLVSGQPMKVWVEYDAVEKQLNVTLAPANVVSKPRKPLLSLTRDLSPILKDTMHVGFASSTGAVGSNHYVLGWSFKFNGQAQELDFEQLPKLPGYLGPSKNKKGFKPILTIVLPIVLVIAMAISVIVYVVKRNKRFVEVIENWDEVEFRPHSVKYKDLCIATKGFIDKELLGKGGFGSVYKGMLPNTSTEIAVKKVSNKSRQGMKEFASEIASMSRLRHRNLVPLLGYCQHKGELLLVYDYMPNGSLDKYLFNQPKTTLNWNQRFRVIKGVASGLLYLHEEWEQVVVHRDVKASNILLDSDFNGRLGDFGLARFYDHGTDHQTTHVAGTLGYLAPELTRMGKATTSSDVFAFGAFLLEVACGRRPIDRRQPQEDAILVDRVFSCWDRGDILEAKDQKLGSDIVAEEVEVVLKLGLWCSHSEAVARPSMRVVVEHLEKLNQLPLPDLSQLQLSANGLTFAQCEGFDNKYNFQPSVVDSILSCGR